MRNVLLTLSIVLLPLLGFSQTFLSESGSSDTVSGSYTNGELSVYNRLRSASSANVTVNWKVVDKSIGANWKVNGFCDNLNCYADADLLNGKQYGSKPYTSEPGDFHILYDAAGAANGSSSWVRINVKDAAGAMLGYERNLTFIGRKVAAGVVSVSSSADDVVLYPNPARDAVNVIFDEKAGVKTIAVYNLIGKLMGPVYKPATNSSAKIELDDMPNGVYFLRLMDGYGHIVATRRFTRQ